jgi:SAM-dependent methyltransferase
VPDAFARAGALEYACNICGTSNALDRTRLGREIADCRGCGSTMRFRAVVGLLARELFGATLGIDEFPPCPRLRGLGMSDWAGYADRLAACMDYTNTFFHQPPRLDITRIPDELVGSCDFLISSDVLEHVVPPVGAAFSGARRLLKPGGLLVLTVPFRAVGEHTVEHFPALNEWTLARQGDGGWRLDNRRRDGTREVFTDLNFHGGPGTTLEMRVFTRASLISELEHAGFRDIRVASEPMPGIGVVWPSFPDPRAGKSLPVVARA